MKVAAVQLSTGADSAANLQLAQQQIRQAAAAGAHLVVLPEATMQAFGTGRLDTQAEPLDGPFVSALRDLADDLGISIVAGIFEPADTLEPSEPGGKTINRIYNTAVVISGGQVTGYRKIHTYDAFSYRESDTVKPGQEPLVVDIAGLKVGVAVCYDIRFPQLFRTLARRGAELIVVPTSWANGPGKLEQWRTLAAARALDSTAYVLAAGQARPEGDTFSEEIISRTGQQPQRSGDTDGGPTGIGYSVIVDPTGHRLVEAGYDPTIIYAEIDRELVERTRQALPVLAQD